MPSNAIKVNFISAISNVMFGFLLPKVKAPICINPLQLVPNVGNDKSHG